MNLRIVILRHIFIISIAILYLSCTHININEISFLKINQAKIYALSQLEKCLIEIPAEQYPIRTLGEGPWKLTEPSQWTSGFYPGCLWLAYQLSNDSSWIEPAQKYTEGLTEQQYNTSTHDIGFMMFNSFGNGYKCNQNNNYKNIIIQSARSLATRYNEKTKCIQSWNGDFQVIIDNMMNLEILFWAAKNGAGNKLYDIAVTHANTTINNHIRKDYSTFHVIVFDTASGEVVQRKTHQGYADNSTWARGQAWGVYGFTVCFRETRDSVYLKTAEKMAEHFINNLSDDLIPYWDFNLPYNYNKKLKDTSAASIFLSGLLELRKYVKNSNQYDEIIQNILTSLITDYLTEGTKSSGILLHAAYNVNSENKYDWDASTIWGDYYFLEALKRYQESFN
jgi:unsaturated chondroitin disaccharide hydrolase